MSKVTAQNFESNVDYTTVLNNFEGPLDLLLYLVKTNEIEIKEIFVSQVMEQFLAYMRGLPHLDVDKASEYLVIASTILSIKAKSLVPDEEEEDFIFPLSANIQQGDAFILPRRKTAKTTGMPYSPLLKQVYSAEGEYLGCVRDVVLENLTVVELIAGEKRYPFASVKAFGDCILLHSTNKNTKAKAKKPTHPLFGKLIRFDVWDKKGNLLFKKGKSVTHQIIKTAKKHKKILELTVKTLAY